MLPDKSLEILGKPYTGLLTLPLSLLATSSLLVPVLGSLTVPVVHLGFVFGFSSCWLLESPDWVPSWGFSFLRLLHRLKRHHPNNGIARICTRSEFLTCITKVPFEGSSSF